MKKKKFLLLSIVVIALLALVAVGTVLGQEPEEPEELPPLPNATPEVPVDEEEQAGVLPAAAVDAAFTYQGRLTDSGGSPVSDGVYDFEVQFWNGPDPSTAAQVGATIAAADTVSNGFFELTLPVTHDDFNGQELYLRMRIRPDGGTWDAWTDTQPILPVPYALSLRPGATIGGTGAGNGMLALQNSAGTQTYHLNGGNGYFTLGASGVDGDLAVLDGGGQTALLLDGDTAQLTLGDSGGGNPGDLIIRDNNGDDTIWLDGNNRRISGGLQDNGGDLEMRTNDEFYIYLDADNNSNSWFRIYSHTDATSNLVFRVEDDGDVRADGGYYCGRSYNGTGLGMGLLTETDLEAGPCLQDDSPADFAEMLPAQEELELGDVLVVAPDGTLARSSESHQPTVVGVYSTRPSYVGSGRLLGQPGYAPLAIVGIVPVKASAENGSIQPGDLLVASATPGHAMKADPNPPQGTVIGKALGALEKGTGIIELLVMLQ